MSGIYIEENKLVIPCEGSSDIELLRTAEGVAFSYDYGACHSKSLSKEEIDLLVSFLGEG